MKSWGLIGDFGFWCSPIRLLMFLFFHWLKH
jgi:hypothetical protein